MVHGFANFRDGAEPENLIVVGNRFYGTTFVGGLQGKTDCKQGCGVVFSMAMDGSGYRVLHRFKGGTDGAGPTSTTLIDNAIFGVTYQGGKGPCPDYGFGFTGCGTVFRISPDGSGYAQLHVFSKRNGKDDGAYPADVIFYHGDLYGSTYGGGGKCHPNGCGTIFRLSVHGGGFAIVYAFTGGRDGASPGDGLAVMGDALFGTTENGGKITKGVGTGTIFRISAGSKYKQIHSLQRYGMPEAGLLAYSGSLLVRRQRAVSRPVPTAAGAFFRFDQTVAGLLCYTLSIASQVRLRRSQSSEPRWSPLRLIVGRRSTLPARRLRNVFSISPNGANFQVLYSFKGGAQGASPGAIVAVGSRIYGVAQAGPRCGHYRNCRITFGLQTGVPSTFTP